MQSDENRLVYFTEKTKCKFRFESIYISSREAWRIYLSLVAVSLSGIVFVSYNCVSVWSILNEYMTLSYNKKEALAARVSSSGCRKGHTSSVNDINEKYPVRCLHSGYSWVQKKSLEKKSVSFITYNNEDAFESS